MNTIKHSVKKWGIVICSALLLTQAGCRLPGLPPPPGLPGLPPPPLPPFGSIQPSTDVVAATQTQTAKPEQSSIAFLAKHTP